MHYSLQQRFQSFLIGMVTSSLILFPVSRAWAAAGPGVYEPQELPTTSQEITEAVTAIHAGLDVVEAVEPQPAPPRQYVAFLSNLWQQVVGTPFDYGQSGLISYDWILSGTGASLIQTDSGVSLGADILLSVNFPQDGRIGMTPLQASMFESAGASLGMAWVHVTSDIGDAYLFVSWLQFNDNQGVPVTVIAPIQTVLDDDWDRLAASLPIYLDFLDELWDFDLDFPESSNPSNEFERDATWSLRRAAIQAGGAILVGAVGVIAALSAPVSATAAAAAIIVAQITTLIAIGVVVGVQQTELAQLFEKLREALRDGACGFPSDTIDVDTLTWEELLNYARQYCNPV